MKKAAPLIPLDKALAAAQSGKESDQGAYYTLLLNTTLLVPAGITR